MQQASGHITCCLGAHHPATSVLMYLLNKIYYPPPVITDLIFTSSTTGRFGAASVLAKGKLQHITQSAEKGRGHDLVFYMQPGK